MPVQQVRLALYFPSLTVDAFSLAGIRAVWGEYRKATLLPPATLRDTSEPSKQGADLVASERWPLGLMMFDGGEDCETRLCQSDRMGVTWDAKKTGRPYPGYDQFKSILAERFRQLTDTLVHNGLDTAPIPNCCECIYENVLEDVPASRIMYRIITGANATAELPRSTSDFFKHHYHWDGRNRYANVIVVNNPKRSTRVIFEVTAEQTSDETPKPDEWRTDIDLCHSQARQLYADFIEGAK